MPAHTHTSVRGAVFALLFSLLCSLPQANAQLHGKWQCDTKSGKSDATTNYEMHCDGFLIFKADQTLESTCLDGFFPTGTFWQEVGNRLILKDTDGQAFADFEILKVDSLQLLLFRKGVTYTFRKTI
ncbi:MAG: hypothetical protein KF734_15585 [Saprospiraceae bacterium]|nr:hypothetical protein [Saprospiraceae bacterium]